MHCLLQLEQAQTKAKNELKQLAKKGDAKNAKVLAKEVVRSNKQKDRLHVSKARLGSIGVQLSQQLGALLTESSRVTSREALNASLQQWQKLPARYRDRRRS